jgi:hypothetical protein
MKKILLSFLTISLSCFGFAWSQNQNALSFDNSDDYVDVPNASNLIVSSNSLSLTCWVYPVNTAISFPDYDGFCGFRNNTDCDFYLIQHAPTSVEARFRNSAGTNTDVVITNLQINVWQHFALTYDGAMLRLYMNGAEVGNAPASGTITNSTAAFYIGNLLYSAVQFYMNGKIDEVSLWNKALSQEEIFHIYDCAVDPSASNLLLYYKFDQGTANGNNTAITDLIPSAGSLNGILHNFALTGTVSNFVEGVSSPIYQVSETICNGESYQFGDQLLTVPGVYTHSFPTTSGCDSVVELTLQVITLNTAVSLIGVTLTAQLSGASYQWLNCGTAYSVIPGATGQSYTATANGSYAVKVTQDNCSDTSFCVPVTTVGIAAESTFPGLALYPNPVEDKLFLNFDRIYPEVSFDIYSLHGQKVLSGIYHEKNSILLNVSDLPSGSYIIQIRAGNYEAFRKIIK